jgi:hypothetical protein
MRTYERNDVVKGEPVGLLVAKELARAEAIKKVLLGHGGGGAAVSRDGRTADVEVRGRVVVPMGVRWRVAIEELWSRIVDWPCIQMQDRFTNQGALDRTH